MAFPLPQSLKSMSMPGLCPGDGIAVPQCHDGHAMARSRQRHSFPANLFAVKVALLHLRRFTHYYELERRGLISPYASYIQSPSLLHISGATDVACLARCVLSRTSGSVTSCDSMLVLSCCHSFPVPFCLFPDSGASLPKSCSTSHCHLPRVTWRGQSRSVICRS